MGFAKYSTLLFVLAGTGFPVLSAQAPGLDPSQNGACVNSAGDVNLDGFTDIIVGAWWDTADEKFGSATVFSGKDGSVLYTVRGEEEGALFGLSAAGAGDADADGAADFIVGAPLGVYKKKRTGVVYVYSGRTGKLMHEIGGDEEGERFGWSVNTAGDVDQNAAQDFIVGAPYAKRKKKEDVVGRARVFDGKKGKAIHEFFGDEHGDLFGFSVDSAGSTLGDGSSDVVVGAWGGNYARVFSGRKGSEIATLRPEEEGGRFGWVVRTAGDVNQSGMSNVIVGMPWAEKECVWVVDSKSGDKIFQFDGDAAGEDGWCFGGAVDGAGDVNGDGFADMIIGDPGFPWLFGADGLPLGERFQKVREPMARPGRAIVVSGNGGDVLFSLEGSEKDDCFGVSVSSAGDVNQDGFGDVVVGSGPHAAVHAQVFSGHDGTVLHSLRVEP